MKIIFGFYLALCLFCFPREATDPNVTLKIKITNLDEADSNVLIAVYRTYDTFLTDDMYCERIVAVRKRKETEVEFQVVKGEYAVAVFQDKNKNGDLDRNMFSFPTEPYGFSNNFRPSFRPPDWTDVAFKIDRERIIEVELN